MRLIDADKLVLKHFVQRVTEQPISYEGTQPIYANYDIIAYDVDHAPTVDAEPVRHGRWIKVDVGDCCYRCSECGFIRDGYLLDVGNYCPKCGAKMEKENL